MKPLTSVEGTRALEVVVCLEDSIIDVLHLRSPGQVRAGHDVGCQVVLPAEALGGHGSLVLASLDAAGQAYAATVLDASGSMRPIGPEDNVSLESGKLRVFVRSVPDVQAATRGGFRLDPRTWRVVGASAAGHLLFLWLLLAIPPDARAINGMDFYRNERLVKITAKPLEDEKQEPPKPSDARGTGGEAAGASAAPATGLEGKMGKPDTVTKGSTALKGTDKIDKPSGNVRDWVSSRGPLGVIRATDWSPITGVDVQFAKNDRIAYGSDLGPPGDGAGTLGTGYNGDRTGGCPPGAKHCTDGTIGTRDGYTIGLNPGKGDVGFGPGNNVHPRGHDPLTPPRMDKISVGPDGLDKAIIKRYIHKRLDAISYCYERQLNVQASLGGTITVEFVIDANGAVISARGDGSAGSKAVDGCVLEQVRGIQFPKSASMTSVKYPFTFHTAGQ